MAKNSRHQLLFCATILHLSKLVGPTIFAQRGSLYFNLSKHHGSFGQYRRTKLCGIHFGRVGRTSNLERSTRMSCRFKDVPWAALAGAPACKTEKEEKFRSENGNLEVLAVSVRFRRRQKHDASRVILAPSPCLRNYVIAQSLGRLVPVVLTISSASSSLDNPPGPTLPSPPISFRS